MPKRGEYKKTATADSKRQRRYNGSEDQKKRRASRNAARRKMGDGPGDVDHKDGNPLNNSKGNLRRVSVKTNRSDNKPRRKPSAIFGKKSSSKKVSTFSDLSKKGSETIAKSRKKK